MRALLILAPWCWCALWGVLASVLGASTPVALLVGAASFVIPLLALWLVGEALLHIGIEFGKRQERKDREKRWERLG